MSNSYLKWTLGLAKDLVTSYVINVLAEKDGLREEMPEARACSNLEYKSLDFFEELETVANPKESLLKVVKMDGLSVS